MTLGMSLWCLWLLWWLRLGLLWLLWWLMQWVLFLVVPRKPRKDLVFSGRAARWRVLPRFLLMHSATVVGVGVIVVEKRRRVFHVLRCAAEKGTPPLV